MTAIKAAHRTKRGADASGMVALVLGTAMIFAHQARGAHQQHTRQGVAVTRQHTEQRDGANGENGRCGVYGRDGRIWLIDRWLWLVWGIESQKAGN